MKKRLIVTVLVLSAFSCIQAQKSEIFAPDGKALQGYDPVAFFRSSKPVMGNDSLSYSWKNATWLFSSRENLDSFIVNPDHYTPQYGGYCAFGTSQDHKAPTEAGTWTIVDDKLYFNYNTKVQRMWLKDQSAFIKKADQNWPALKDRP